MLKVVNLRVEHQVEPAALGLDAPCFSWALESNQHAVVQLAYCLRVFEGERLVFDTERVDEAICIGIDYQGEVLKPLTTYTVRVEVWDNLGSYAHAQSCFTTARFDMPWEAHWVEPVQEPNIVDALKGGFEAFADMPARDDSTLRPAQYLRTAFPVKTGLKRALAFATAHGIYRLFVNGKRAGEAEFAPEPTSYETFLQYQTYDVTDLIVPGENVLGAILADGWWVGRIGILGESCQYGDKTAILSELRLEYEDGTICTVKSDDFKSSTGAIEYSDIFIGERYDARKESSGWSVAGFDDGRWTPVNAIEVSMDNLAPQMAPPVAIEREFVPKSVIHAPNGDVIVDLGQVIAGRMRFEVTAVAGVEICLEHSECLDENGNFFCNILGRNKDQKDVYIARRGKQTYEPMFTYHGFRYVRITGWPGELSENMFTAVVLSSKSADMGAFECSDERINRLQQNIRWSQISNTLAIPTDCPQRERAGWTGDISVFAPTMTFNRESYAFLSRWLADCRHAQMEDGQVPVVVPYWPAYRRMMKGMGGDTSAGWSDAIVTVAWALFNAYGNPAVLRDNYEAMTKWMDYVEAAAQAGEPEGWDEFDDARKERNKYLWNTGFHFGDWLIPSLSGTGIDGITGSISRTGSVVASAYFAYTTNLMAQSAMVLDELDDYKRYVQLNQKVTEAFITEYVREDGTLEADYQGIYVLCLYADLVPEELREKMTAHLCDMIGKNNGCLDTGFLSVPFLMDVLCREKRRDVAFDLLFQTNCPSWLYQVEKGATSIWESWSAIAPDGRVTNASYNHYAFGCVGDWMYREVAGMTASMPGYKRIRFAPGVDSGLEHASASHITPYGKASIHWSRQAEGYKLCVEVPANTEADIFFPAGSYTRNAQPVKAEDGVLAIGMRAISVGSGVYEFEFK